MKKRMMVTGADGFLGSRIAAYYEKKYEVIRAGRSDLNITDENAVAEFLREKTPAAVIHCAAISDVGTCENNPELSETVNLYGTVNLAKACKESGIKLLFMSSDQIYAGSRLERPNLETDQIPLINVYGRHKKQAEEKILEILPDGICLRLSWMYDFPVRGLKSSNNLLARLLKAMLQNQPICLPVHDYRGITWVQEVVKNIEPAMELPGGIYNFGSESTCSSYETGIQVLGLLAHNNDKRKLVLPNEDSFAGGIRNLAMDIGKLKSQGVDFPDTISGFEKCLENSPEYVMALLR
ncbi:MAG: sugar nucleotide-binding protein [Lacrimispora sp.]|uniref:SDR family oxidoreductase n=1 Tax=Lacrimispora sp. TaxID=2719234 RepID=UPI0039E391F8